MTQLEQKQKEIIHLQQSQIELYEELLGLAKFPDSHLKQCLKVRVALGLGSAQISIVRSQLIKQ